MSRAAKWKIEKAKVKVVFRLQFHATHIPQNGWEKLFISFIPTDTGKATAKTSKANVRNGSCKWADPIYETTRLLLDSKTKQYDDKLYKIVVGMGTSRSGILGEATINLADYADASQPSVVALPLHGSDHGTVLHATVQLLTAKTGFREFEQQRDKGLQSGNNVNKETENSSAKSASPELHIPDDLVNKAKARVQLSEETNIPVEYSDSQVTCDESSTTSENYSADKHGSPPEKLDGSDQSKLDDDMAVVYEENHRLKSSLAVAESSISELKQELTTLQNHANEMGTETRKLAQELTFEIVSGQELVKEVNLLKSECSKLKNDLQMFKDAQSSSNFTERKVEKTANDTEVNLVNAVEVQIREIQEKILAREPDSSFLQSDFDVLLSTLQGFRNGKTGEFSILPLRESDNAKAEKENLVKKMNEMECYYESLVHELEENQKRILGDFQNVKTEMNELSLVNNELQKRVTVSESALKRARLNYSIAVSQLQKDLDMLSFQVLSMFETNQTVIKEAFADDFSEPSPNHLSNDLKKSLRAQENIYKKVEEEISEMCCANLELNVYAGTLEETLFEARDCITKTNKKLRELDEKLRSLNRSHDVLFNENRMLESDLGNLSNENFLLMEKITECEALVTEYRVYKHKYEDVSAEKLEFQKLLEAEAFDKQNLLKEIEILKDKSLQDLMIYEENTRELESHRSEVCHVRKLSSDNEMEIGQLKDMLTKSKAEIERLKDVQRKLDDTESRLKGCIEKEDFYIEENGILKMEVESVRLELQSSVARNAEIEESKTAHVLEASQLKEMLTKSKDEVARFIEENRNLKAEVESLRLELEASVAKNAEILSSQTESVLVANQLNETLTKSKDEVASYVEENGILKTEVESLRLELQALVAKNAEIEEYKTENVLVVNQLNETLTKSKDEVARYIEENGNLKMEVESLKLELHASLAKNAEIEESKTERALEAGQLKEMLTKSKEDVDRFIEENGFLKTEVESLKLELQASAAKNAEIEESKTGHALEAGQLQEMLTKSKEDVARYIEENSNLAIQIESLQLELQDSAAKNAEISESKIEHALEADQLQRMLTKSKEEVASYIEENRNLAVEIESLTLELQALVVKNAEISESQTEHALEASQLQERLTKTNEDVARFTEENRNLAMEIESLSLELQALVAKNGELEESKTVHDHKASQLQEMLTKSKEDIARFVEENGVLKTEVESLRLELQASVNEISESKTAHALEASQMQELLTKSKEDMARFIEENRNLKTEVETLRLELQASVNKLDEISESKTMHALEASQLQEMLTKSKEDIARLIEENDNLKMQVESLRLELQASVNKIDEISESKTEHALEASQLKLMLTKSNDDVARFIEENGNLKTEVESLRSELQASVNKIDEISESKTVHALEASQLQEMLTKSNEDISRFVEENGNLKMEVESLRLELQACVYKSAEISESKTEHVLEASQLKEMLTKSNDDVARFIEENGNLKTEVESLRSELQASVNKIDEISESKTVHALEASQLQEMLTKSNEDISRFVEENGNLKMEVESLRLELQVCVYKNAEISESKTEHVLEASQLKEMLTKSNDDMARYTEENRNLASKIESLSLELQASVAKNAEIEESKTEHTLKASQLQDMLTKSKEDIARLIEENDNLKMQVESLRLELQASVNKIDEISESKTEHALEASQLKETLTKSNDEVARFIEENGNLKTEVESLRSELQASVNKIDEISESKTVHALEASQLQEMLTKSNEDISRFVEENGNLKMEVESLRLELQALVAKNAEFSESKTVNALEASQLKEMLTKSNDDMARYTEENRNLASKIESLSLELQASVAKNAEIEESKTEHTLKASQLQDMLTKSKEDVARFLEENGNLKSEVESLRLELQALVAKNAEFSESKTVNALEASQLQEMLTKSKEDEARFLEESGVISLVFKSKLKEQHDELLALQNNCNQLTNKLLEQKLKTEEFKNLSIYLKELKDNADAAHEQKERDTEGPTESLRIAFIKEQYQTKVQELKQQLSVSKKHNEEMLFRLQDALDEIENRKKSEASQLRRIQELEAEGESVISDKSDYDRVRAELECAVLSLECCKEEKEKLVGLLQECENEKSRIGDELSLIREKLARNEENGSVNAHEFQGVTNRAYEDEENPTADDSKQLTVVNYQFRTQHLISCMEQLDGELEKMKNDNSLILPLTNGDPSFQDLQRELAQLHQVNEELGSIYPNFVDFRGNGNALERVLALEIELAEALRTKKKSSIQFQSSFLKQHSDEEAVFKSFRDINELIKDMLEIKGKYASVENELKDMHDRYSQLSLQFAEVEGERQKLMMTLKNVKSSRNLLRMNRSSMAALGDQSL